MKTAPFNYYRPVTVAESVQLLSTLGEDAKVISGGQSLLPIMNMRLAEPSDLVDVSRIRELLRSESTGDHTTYGAAVTHMMFEDGLVPDAAGGLLRAAAAGIGYRAVRNRGTLGGSLAHSDSSAEWPTVMAALGASVTAVSTRGTRIIPVRELLQGFFTTALAFDELIISIEVPRLDADRYWGLHKTSRKLGEFADSLAIAMSNMDPASRLASPEIWLGAARDVPTRLASTEEAVAGRAAADISVAELVLSVAHDIGAAADNSDVDARHHLQLHAVTVHRALLGMRKAIFDE